jgi:hypothetical protein
VQNKPTVHGYVRISAAKAKPLGFPPRKSGRQQGVALSGSRLQFKLMGWMAPSRLSAKMKITRQERSMDEVSTIGIDLAKHVFQLHGVDGPGRVVTAKGKPSIRQGMTSTWFDAQIFLHPRHNPRTRLAR